MHPVLVLPLPLGSCYLLSLLPPEFLHISIYRGAKVPLLPLILRDDLCGLGLLLLRKSSVSSNWRATLIRLSLDDLFRRHPPLEGTYIISMLVNVNAGGRELDVASRAPLLKASIPGVVALSFVTVLLRLVARGWIVRRIRADDWLIVLAWVWITIN